MDRVCAQHGELKRFLDQWCKQQEEFLQFHLGLPADAGHESEPLGDASSLLQPKEASRAFGSGTSATALEFELAGSLPLDVNTVLVPDTFTTDTTKQKATVEVRNLANEAPRESTHTVRFESPQSSPCPSSHSSDSGQSADSEVRATVIETQQRHAPIQHRRRSDIEVSPGLKRQVTVVLSKRYSMSSVALQRILSVQDTDSTLSGMRSCLSKVVKNSAFESFIAVVIMINAGLMSVQANREMNHLYAPSDPTVENIELAFCIIYAGEVLMRLMVYGKQFFVDEHWKWNWFDMFLVGMAVHDQIMSAVAEPDKAINVSFFRMLRLLKMLKLLRMIRLMKVFKELRLILYAVAGCLQAMFWACVLILIISYVAGILFVQACALYLRDEGVHVSPDTRELIHEYWDDVGTAMLSLFMACTAGKEWTHIASALKEAGVLWYAIFVAYIAFFAFVIMNTLTSLFVDTVMDHSQKDLEMLIRLELEKKGTYINMLKGFFQAIDVNHSGTVSCDEFEQHLQNPTMQGFFYSMEIDIVNAHKFFRILSHDGAREVDLESFVVGCIKLKGTARSVDLIELLYSHKKYVSDQAVFAKETVQRLQTLEKSMQYLADRSQARLSWRSSVGTSSVDTSSGKRRNTISM